jgi:hypothetical protein
MAHACILRTFWKEVVARPEGAVMVSLRYHPQRQDANVFAVANDDSGNAIPTHRVKG